MNIEQLTGPAEPELGVLLGTYRLLSIVGRGGMGVVYRAQDTVLEREVALKLLSAATAESRERFLREARLAAGLSHQNIVTVHHVGEHNRIPYIVTELMTGGSLTARIRSKGKLTPLETCRVGAAAARALDYAHKRHIIHRDVKPPNLLIAPDGSVKLGDFGLARSLNDSMELTRSGSLMGTPQYVAPELCVGEKATAASDVYALGCSLYFLLTGEHPFKAESVYQVLYMQVHTPFPDLRKKAPHVPPALVAAINRAVAKKPADRWPSAGAFADELDRISEEIVTGRSRRRGGGVGRLSAWSATAAVLAGAVFLAVRYLPELQPPATDGHAAASDGRAAGPVDKTKTTGVDAGVRDRIATDGDKRPPPTDKTARTDIDKDKSKTPAVDKEKSGPPPDKYVKVREEFARLLRQADGELEAGWKAADPRRVESAVDGYQAALRLITDDGMGRQKLEDARSRHAKLVQYHSLLVDADAAVGARRLDAAVESLKKAAALGVPDNKAQVRLAELDKRRENLKKALALQGDGRAALEKKSFAVAEKLLREAASLLPENDPDRIPLLRDLDTAQAAAQALTAAVEELRRLERAAIEALEARDAERLLKVLAADETAVAAAGALCARLRHYGKVEVVAVGEPLKFIEPDPFGPTAPLSGRFKLTVGDDFGGGRVRRLELPLGDGFTLIGLPGGRKMAAKPWLPAEPEGIARETVEIEKALEDLGSLDPARIAARLAAPAPAARPWLEWLDAYRRTAHEQGRKFAISQRLHKVAVYPAVDAEPDEALAVVEVGFGGARTVKMTYRWRKDAGVWKLMDQRRADP